MYRNRPLFLPVLSLAFAVSGAQASSIAPDHRHFQPSTQKVRTAKILGLGGKFKAPSSPDNWLGGTGNWSNGSEWSAGLPGSGSDVSINTGNDNVTLDTGSSINSLTLGGASGSSKLTGDGNAHNLSLAGVLTINQSGNLYLFTDTMTAGTNSANLGVLSVEYGSSLRIDGNFNNSGTFNEGLSNLSSGNSLNVNGTLTNSGTIGLGYYNIVSGGSGTVTVGGLNNTGTMRLSGAPPATFQVIGNGTNSGMISVENSGQFSVSGNFTNSGMVFTTFNDNGCCALISVAGTLTNTASGSLTIAGDVGTGHAGTLVNQGQITLEPDVASDASFTVAGDATNSGTILLTGTGGGISDQLSIGGTLTNSTGGQLNLSGISGQVSAGRLINNGTINLESGFSGNLQVTGNIQNSGTINAIFGTMQAASLTNSGTIQMGNSATLRVSGDVSNSGTIRAGGDFSELITIGGKLTNTAGGTFALDSSSYTANVAYISNAGTISLGSGTTLNVTGGSRAPVTALPGFLNTGLVNISQGSTLSSPLAFTQTGGQTTIDGTLRVSSRGVINFAGGSVYGNQGILQGSVISNAAFNIGDAQMLVGQMALTGSYTQGTNGSLTFDIAGPAAGQYDQLNISGHAQLNGLLTVDLLHGFVPQVGNTFDIMNFASESGTFSMVVGLPINGQEHFVLEYNSTNLTLDVVQGQLSQPAGGDGTVGSSEPFVTAGSEGEAYSLEASNHGSPSPTPEPSSIWLFASGALGLGSLLRHRR